MAWWASPNNSKPNMAGLEGSEMVMDLVLSQKSGFQLMQNCDLPPPVKVFTGSDKAVSSSLHGIYNMAVEEYENDELEVPRAGTEKAKLELLRALQLSQTRAREAEKKAAVLAEERDRLRDALLEDSSRLFAYRQWVKLLELQLSRLQRLQPKEEEDGGDGSCGMTWFLTLALCLGIAGLSFTFGFRYFI